MEITSSIKRILIGTLLLFTSLVLFFLNEEGPKTSDIARTAKEIKTITAENQKNLHNTLIAFHGTLETPEQLEDLYLKKGKYIQINRIVETYTTDSTRNINTDNPKNKIRYIWKENTNSQNTIQNYYDNTILKSVSKTAHTITLNGYKLSVDTLTLPKAKDLLLTRENTIETDNTLLLNQKYLFNGKGSLNDPKIGDVRIHYTVISSPSDPVTFFGTINPLSKTLSPYSDTYYTKNVSLYRVFNADKNSAIQELQNEENHSSWIFRFIAFTVLWIGLLLLIAPFHKVIKNIPFIGKMKSIGIILIAGICAILLSSIILFTLHLFYKGVFIIGGILFILFGIIIFYKK